MKDKDYIIVRIIKEYFAVTATSKEKALKIVEERGDPYNIVVVKESITQNKNANS